jgi:hypothetical protein
MQARRLLNIEPMEETTHSEIDNGGSDSIDEDFENTEDLMVVTIHELIGYSNPKIIRVSRYLKCQLVTILIHIGSTNNILDGDVVKRL